MDGFVVLGGSRTDLLRDGDTLLVSLGNKRGLAGDEPADSGGAAVQPPAAKRHKPQVLPATAPESSSSEDESSSSEEESSSSEEESSSSKEESSSSESKGSGRQQDMQTPTAAAPIANNATTVRVWRGFACSAAACRTALSCMACLLSMACWCHLQRSALALRKSHSMNPTRRCRASGPAGARAARRPSGACAA